MSLISRQLDWSSATVIAAAFWFILNPDFKSKSAIASRVDGAAAPAAYAEKESLIGAKGPSRSPASVGAQADGAFSAGGSAGLTSPVIRRIVHENILIQVGPAYTDFEPNSVRGDSPYDRRVITRWKNYGALCPKNDCAPKELVFLEDGAIRIRGTNAGPGMLTLPELKALRETFAKIIATESTERRIDDPKFAEVIDLNRPGKYAV